jgi:hypothetical protein
MKLHAKLFVVALSGIGASCGTMSSDQNDASSVAIEMSASSQDGMDFDAAAPAPAGEVASSDGSGETSMVLPQFAHLPTYSAAEVFAGTGNAGQSVGKLPAGRFAGNLELDQSQTALAGSGFGETVIDGNLLVGGNCTVTGLTVTGDVIFCGNNARVNVECLGQVLDYGMQNRH